MPPRWQSSNGMTRRLMSKRSRSSSSANTAWSSKQVEAAIVGVPEGEERRMFTQALLNRLLFCWFLQKRGWLNRDHRYLPRLLEVARAHASKPGSRAATRHNFYDDYLYHFFFWAMNTPMDQRLTGEAMAGLQDKLGMVPFINGGLFEQQSEYDFPGKVKIPNDAFSTIFELFDRYNFTVTESTPLDVEVAIDPEMLGKVFEELVTGRHETGSYYTPHPVVSFMCREALKHHVSHASCVPADVASHFVDDGDPSDLPNPETVLDALKSVKVCDPACGSGAYLLGMMQELLRLREALFAAKVKDYRTLYERKLDIIQNNLYGVDKDRFAVNIAMLRLWLSLVVDDPRDPLDDPDVDVSLPNLSYKNECGDSLTAPNPQDSIAGGMFRHRALQLAEELSHLKARFMRSTGTDKKDLGNQIREHEAELASALTDSGNPSAPDGSLDWRVAFAEVFVDDVRSKPRSVSGVASTNGTPLHCVPDYERGGFDIVLANPPYVRQELLGRDYKENSLKPVFPEVYTGTCDLYVYFYARAHQLLRQNGVACFISSNKWLRAGYGEKLRQHLLDSQAFHLVVDFGELPVFGAATFLAVFLWQKEQRGDTATAWAVVKDLEGCYNEGIREHVTRIAQTLPGSQFGTGKARLAVPAAADRRAKMEASGPRLGEIARDKAYCGIVTGLNKAFVVDSITRNRLVEEDRSSVEIIKPFIIGDDIRRCELHYREAFLVFTRWGTDIQMYPAIQRHLSAFRVDLTPRKSPQDRRGRRPGPYEWHEIRDPIAYYELFGTPKIMYPEIAKEPRFAMDFRDLFGADTTHFIAIEDWYLLGVPNSVCVFEYLKYSCSVLGDEDNAGRLRLKPIYMETLPIPDASTADRESVAKLAQVAQRLHTQRRQRVEQFLRDLGASPAESSSRNPLEQPWTLTPEEFTKRAHKHGTPDPRLFTTARDETAALTDEIAKVAREIDGRVAGLYGL